MVPLGVLKLGLTRARAFRLPRPGGVAALGDSITAGDSLPELGLLADNSWMTWLGRSVPYCFNGALPETPTPALVDRLPHVLGRRPDVIVLLVGTYDVWKREEERGLVDIAGMIATSTAAGVEPILGTVPPVADYGERIRPWNAALLDLAETHKLRTIDFHAALECDGDYGPGLTRDGLHPTPAGAKVMADAARPILLDALGR